MIKLAEKKPAEEKKKEEEKHRIQEYGIDKEKTLQKSEQERIKSLKSKLKRQETEIKRQKKEKVNLKEELLRKIAEMENLKKRLEREKSEFYQYALFELLKELLVVLDNFERALESQDQKNGKSFREGINMIYKQYRDLLIKQGIKPIEIKEKKFDPHLHQAFAAEESEDVEEPEVIEELQEGFILHDRLLRPALVRVKIPKKEK